MNKPINLLDKEVEKTSRRTHSTRETECKKIIEALLFSSSESLSAAKIKEIIEATYPISKKEIAAIVSELNKEYQKSGRTFQIDEIGEGYLLRTTPEMYPFVEQLHQDRRGDKLSHAAREVLAIIAYKQPITRREIEEIRGVDSSGTAQSLLERGLIEPVGRKEAPGKPVLFGITKKFMQHFGLKDLQELAQI